MIKMVEINDSQFSTIVLKSSVPVLVECASPECIICKAMADRIHEVAKEYSSRMAFFRMNINENKRWKDFNVRVIPTLLYFRGGILVARQDSFPDLEEIRAQVRLITGKAPAIINVYSELKTAIDLEAAGSKFYKYVAANAKNGQVKEKFKLMQQESVIHKELLQGKLQELTGEVYVPDTSHKLEDAEMRPQSFSLIGALKMAIKIEEKVLAYYKKLQKDKLFPEKELFKRLIRDESGHLRELQREMKFVHNKELFSSIETPEYSTWLHKVFE